MQALPSQTHLCTKLWQTECAIRLLNKSNQRVHSDRHSVPHRCRMSMATLQARESVMSHISLQRLQTSHKVREFLFLLNFFLFFWALSQHSVLAGQAPVACSRGAAGSPHSQGRQRALAGSLPLLAHGRHTALGSEPGYSAASPALHLTVQSHRLHHGHQSMYYSACSAMLGRSSTHAARVQTLELHRLRVVHVIRIFRRPCKLLAHICRISAAVRQLIVEPENSGP